MARLSILLIEPTPKPYCNVETGINKQKSTIHSKEDWTQITDTDVRKDKSEWTILPITNVIQSHYNQDKILETINEELSIGNNKFV